MEEWLEFSGKTVDDAITEALLKFNTTSDNIEYEVIERESNGFLGLFNNKPAKIKARKLFSVSGCIVNFLTKVLKAMNIEANIEADFDEVENTVSVDIVGNDMGVLIGKRGQTLDAIQYLTRLVVNKDDEKYKRVVVDAENYRAKREKTLEQLANRLADKVMKTKKSVRLEPMNAYERKIIHATLQSNPKITTRSEGEEPYRRVIIELK